MIKAQKDEGDLIPQARNAQATAFDYTQNFFHILSLSEVPSVFGRGFAFAEKTHCRFLRKNFPVTVAK